MISELDAKFVPLTFINHKDDIQKQIDNTIIFNVILSKMNETTTLGKLLSKSQYGYTAKAVENGNCKYVRITDLKSGFVDWDSVPFCECENIEKYLLKKNDILIARTGGTTGKSYIVDEYNYKAVFASYLIRLSPYKDINPKYIHAFLNSYYFWNQILEMKKGTAQPNVNAQKMKQLIIPVCSKEMQDDIWEKNDSSILNEINIKKNSIKDRLSKINSISIENINQQNLLTKLKQSILQEAIEGKLTAKWRKDNQDIEPASILLEKIQAEKEQLIKDKKIKKSKPLAEISEEEIPFEKPDNWTNCRLGDIFTTTSGGTPTRGNYSYWNGDISWLKSGEMTDNLIIKDSGEKITELGLKESSATLFPKNTVLMAMYGATAGKLGILTFPSTTNQAVCGFYENQFILKELLFFFLKSQREKILKDSWGQSQPNISQTYIKDIVFSLPPIEEQKEIINKIEKLFAICDELEEQINSSKQNTQTLMQAVLKEAFER